LEGGFGACSGFLPFLSVLAAKQGRHLQCELTMVPAIHLDVPLEVVFKLIDGVGEFLVYVVHQTHEHLRNQIFPTKGKNGGQHMQFTIGNLVESKGYKVFCCTGSIGCGKSSFKITCVL
jgi:hypothetical protein